jgi:predicted SAM-dependent methyltransferase
MAGWAAEISIGRISVLLLNIGSGQRPFQKPWINIDKQAVNKPDLICDVGNPLDPLPYEDGTVDMIVLHHVLEHYGCGEAQNLLDICHRLLKDGGSLLIFVPDMSELAKMFIRQEITAQIYFTNVYGAYQGHDADRHKWGYDKHSLYGFLMTHGFDPHRFNWRPIGGADIARDRWILGIEAIK